MAEVETDKAIFQVEAEREGFVLALNGELGASIDVGSVLLWMGTNPGDPIPEVQSTSQSAAAISAEPTAKARALLQQYNLKAELIPAKGERLTAQDVEEYLRTHRTALTAGSPAKTSDIFPGPSAPGEMTGLTLEERGMLRSVQWHRDDAVPAYLELAYDPTPWGSFAERFGEQNKLLMNPLLPLIAHQLARIVHRSPRLNSVVVGEWRYQYSEVNVGFTIQADKILYLGVVRNAGTMSRLAFVRASVDLQHKALRHKLTAAELEGATVGFTSMDRWRVTRHIPVLPPFVSMMIAHTVDRDGRALLGATYDHRLLTGADAVGVLSGLCAPAEEPQD